MIKIPVTEQTEAIAGRVIWFEPPREALKDVVRFMAYAMRYATHEDMRILRQYVSDKEFASILDQVPPGIVDNRSWAYWNAVFGRYPAPSMPVRTFEKGTS